MLNFLKENKDVITVICQIIQALTPVVLGVASFFYYKMVTEKNLKEGDAVSDVKPRFWSFGNPKILAVHLYTPSDDVSGYNHVSQNSRPDQWERLIDISSDFCGLRKTITRKDASQLLRVVISRNGKEKWKTISFME